MFAKEIINVREKTLKEICIKSTSDSVTAAATILALFSDAGSSEEAKLSLRLISGLVLLVSFTMDIVKNHQSSCKLHQAREEINQLMADDKKQKVSCCVKYPELPGYIGSGLGFVLGGIGIFGAISGTINSEAGKILQASAPIISSLFTSTNCDKIEKEIENLDKLPKNKAPKF